jgi:hypothetical protein
MNRSREDEYAEAFRRGYERARQSTEPTVRLDRTSHEDPPASPGDGDRSRDAAATGTSAESDEGHGPDAEADGATAAWPRSGADDEQDAQSGAPTAAWTRFGADHEQDAQGGTPTTTWVESDEDRRQRAGTDASTAGWASPQRTEREAGTEPTERVGLLASAFGASTYDEPAPAPRVPRPAREKRPPREGRPARAARPPREKGPSLGERLGGLRALLAERTARGPQDGVDDDSRQRIFKVTALLVLAFVLIAGAYGVGRMLAADAATATTAGDETGETSEGGAAQKAKPYAGPVRGVPVAGSRAGCQTGASVDAAGNQITYEPAKAHDNDLSTAWRCDGQGIGQRFTLVLPRGTTVAEVGLVPGYAKTDPVSGVDRYAENNRITKVRWRFDGGETFVQRMRGNPADRSMRTLRIPPTTTSRIVIEILRSQPGPRNTVAISEIRVASPAG